MPRIRIYRLFGQLRAETQTGLVLARATVSPETSSYRYPNMIFHQPAVWIIGNIRNREIRITHYPGSLRGKRPGDGLLPQLAKLYPQPESQGIEQGVESKAKVYHVSGRA